MSHTIKADKVRITQEAAKQAAEHYGWQTRLGKVRLFDSQTFEGLAVKIPGWNYEVVVLADGSLVYDNYHGKWGNSFEIEKLTVQSLAVMSNAVVNNEGWAVYNEADKQWEMEVA